MSKEVNVLEYVNKSVVRAGEMELSGLMRWKKYLFILTRYGYLHYFASNDVSFFFST